MFAFAWQSLLALVLAGNPLSRVEAKSPPIVDLGYVRQQATRYNDTEKILTFSNVRYAQAPVGDLRWAPPLPPKHEPNIQRGDKDRICFQAQQAFATTQLSDWIEAWTSNNTAAFFKKYPVPPSTPTIPANLTGAFPPLLPAETDDCLFLDVHVPKEVFDSRGRRKGKKNGYAVFLWVHGGGLVLGSKTSDSNFRGFISASRHNLQKPVIVVSINYRLGGFGFLGGPSLKASGGVSNAGLLDQRLAFKWVQKYIHLFGGDPHQITVAGESAGGASIFHHLTAQGGKGEPLPFQRAIIQSGGWNPTRDSYHLESFYQSFLKALQIDSLQDARRLPAQNIRDASFLLEIVQRWGALGFGVEPDGDYVPDPPAKLLREGKFHRNIPVMIGQNAAEGVGFTSPWIHDEQSTREFVENTIPKIPQSLLSYVTQTLYPPIFDGSTGLPYRTYLERATHFTSEIGIECLSDYLGQAVEGKIFNYLFDVPPALHGEDLGYTFFDGEDNSVDSAVALPFQQYILNFARTGNPNSDSLPRFDEYGRSAWTMDVKTGGFRHITNPGANDRCRRWQDTFFQEKPGTIVPEQVRLGS